MHREDSPLPCHEMTALAFHFWDTPRFFYLPKAFIFSLQWRDNNTHIPGTPLPRLLSFEILWIALPETY